VLARDGYQCRGAEAMGGRCSGPLQVHHRQRHPRAHTLANLVTLCEEHHEGDHGVHRNPERAFEVGLLLRTSDGVPTDEWDPPWLRPLAVW